MSLSDAKVIEQQTELLKLRLDSTNNALKNSLERIKKVNDSLTRAIDSLIKKVTDDHSFKFTESTCSLFWKTKAQQLLI
jgi:hypothetical protein